MNEITDDDVIAAMNRFGGGFIKALAELWRHADSDNKARIKSAWPEYWHKYAEFVKVDKQSIR